MALLDGPPLLELCRSDALGGAAPLSFGGFSGFSCPGIPCKSSGHQSHPTTSCYASSCHTTSRSIRCLFSPLIICFLLPALATTWEARLSHRLGSGCIGRCIHAWSTKRNHGAVPIPSEWGGGMRMRWAAGRVSRRREGRGEGEALRSVPSPRKRTEERGGLTPASFLHHRREIASPCPKMRLCLFGALDAVLGARGDDEAGRKPMSQPCRRRGWMTGDTFRMEMNPAGCASGSTTREGAEGRGVPANPAAPRKRERERPCVTACRRTSSPSGCRWPIQKTLGRRGGLANTGHDGITTSLRPV
jgi:hypothetical protein